MTFTQMTLFQCNGTIFNYTHAHQRLYRCVAFQQDILNLNTLYCKLFYTANIGEK